MFYDFCRAACMIFLRMMFRIKIEGMENIPQAKGYILVANHRSNFDPLFVVTAVHSQVHYMAKAELFKSAIGNRFFRAVGAFPVERGKGDSGAIEWATRLIHEGRVLGMFPEGTRSPTAVPLRPKSGAAMIAQQTGADVLPCAVCFGEKLGFRATVTIRYGTLIKNEAFGFSGELSPHEIKAASRKMMDEIIALMEGMMDAY